MPKTNDDNLVIKSVISGIFSGIVGSLVVLIYISLSKNNTSTMDMLSLIFIYTFTAMTSFTGTIVGSLMVSMPLAMIARKVYPEAFVKGSLFIVFSTLFIWLAVLAWPVIWIFGIRYSEVLLLSPYVFFSAVALTYQVYRKCCV